MSKAKKPRTLVLFFMTGCPHCERNKPAWEDACRRMKGKAEIEEHEARDPETASEGVTSFPTMKLKDGEDEAVLEGAQSSGKVIVETLESDLKKKKSKKGGSRRRRRTHRRSRKLLHRTLRNYVSFR
jgi:glutaredoxin